MKDNVKLDDDGKKKINDEIVLQLRTIEDPEIPINIYDLGLIYKIDISDFGEVNILMTLTNPACPVSGSLVDSVNLLAAEVDGVQSVYVKLTWDPPWTPDKAVEDAQIMLNEMMGEF